MTNARDRIEPLARLVGSMPGHDHAVELQELCFQGSQLGAESHETGACNLGQSFVTCIGDDIEQCSIPLRPTGATMPNSARWARIALITAVCWRINRCRVRTMAGRLEDTPNVRFGPRADIGIVGCISPSRFAHQSHHLRGA